jgi:hypothetical protein
MEPNYKIEEGDKTAIHAQLENPLWKPILMASNGKPGEVFVIFERVNK